MDRLTDRIADKHGYAEIAWAAGFFEGEGSFAVQYANGKDARPIPVIYLVQKEQEPLDRFIAAFGFEPHGKQYREEKHREHAVWRFRIHRWEEVQAVVCAMWPWLSQRRREQALRMLRLGAPRERKPRERQRFCKRGHDLDDAANVYVWRGTRFCRQCQRLRRPKAVI